MGMAMVLTRCGLAGLRNGVLPGKAWRRPLPDTLPVQAGTCLRKGMPGSLPWKTLGQPTFSIQRRIMLTPGNQCHFHWSRKTGKALLPDQTHPDKTTWEPSGVERSDESRLGKE